MPVPRVLICAGSMADRATYVAFLRGINVGGNARILMADLRRIVESLGHTDVATYIQSGNVVFTTARAGDAKDDDVATEDSAADDDLAAAIQAAIGGRLGLDIDVMVRSAAELAQAAEANPFPTAVPKRLLLVFLSERPSEEARAAFAAVDAAPEAAVVTDRTAYLHVPDGIGRAVLPTILERRLKVRGTARNLDTVRAVLALAHDSVAQ